MMATSTKLPLTISGGCLCGSIRYEIAFPEDHQWPPKSSACQCTMCRKWTSSLAPQFIVISPSLFTPALSSQATYTEYESSPGCYRGFCRQCGSPLLWRSIRETETVDFFIGTIDERWILGQIKPGTEMITEYGTLVDRTGGLGAELCTPNYRQYYQENVIPGVTDLLKGGERYLTDTFNGEPLP